MRFSDILKNRSAVTRGKPESSTDYSGEIFFSVKKTGILGPNLWFGDILKNRYSATRGTQESSTDYRVNNFFGCKNRHFGDQTCNLVRFWKIGLGLSEVPDSRWPSPRTHRQRQMRVAQGTTTLTNSCGCMVTSPIRFGSELYLGGTDGQTDVCQI